MAKPTMHSMRVDKAHALSFEQGFATKCYSL